MKSRCMSVSPWLVTVGKAQKVMALLSQTQTSLRAGKNSSEKSSEHSLDQRTHTTHRCAQVFTGKLMASWRYS